MEEQIFQGCSGFEWDSHNVEKNRDKHRVEPAECEEAFFNRPFLVAADILHSDQETRFYALGRSDAGRGLFIVFTVRGPSVRVILARDMSRKEKAAYEEEFAQDSQDG